MEIRMYEKRFGLHRKPFQSVLSDHDFFQSETFREILPGMLHALRSDLGVAVLTGPAGVGKSVALEAVRRKLEGDCQAILIRGGTVKSATDLLFLLHRSLLKCKGTNDSESTAPSDTVRRWEVVERLQRVAEFWGPLVVLLDDAHLLQPEVFAELRALLEEEVAGQKLLRLLITGPLILEEVLAEPHHTDFAQKIRTHVFLQPLRSVEAVEYLRHNIRNAGGELSTTMDSAAIERIVAAADGAPRCLNLLADESMIVCEEQKLNCVTRAIVDKALKRLQHLPYTWNVSLYDDTDDEDQYEESASPPMIEGSNSVVEIGRPAAGSSAADSTSSHGVIEIGGPSPEPLTKTETHGVIEIGDPASTTTHHSAVIEIVASTTSGGDELIETDLSGTLAEDPVSETEVNEEFNATEIDAATFYSDAEDHFESANMEKCDEDDGDSAPDRYANKSRLAALLGRVSFEGSAVIVEESPVDEAEEVLEPEEQRTVMSAVSLEHHMLLAGGAPDDSNDSTICSETADEFEDLELEDFEHDEFESFDNEALENADDDHEVALSGYERWEPAGAWPVATRPSVSVAEKSLRPNSKPVFDRYTWCELGRSVAPLQRNRVEFATVPSVLVWPPVTNGIAPTDVIPVENIHEEYAELLMDLGQLIDATGDAAGATTSVSNSLVAEYGGPNTESQDSTAEFLPLSDGPDAAIEHIQHLIDTEQNERGENKTYGEHASPSDASGRGDKPQRNEDGDSETDRSHSILPLDGRLPNSDAPPDNGGNAEFDQSNDGNDVEEQFSKVGEELLCEERRVGDFVADAEEDAQQTYIPRLLQQARKRVVRHSVGGSRLRYAAGAESYQQPPTESQVEQRGLRLAVNMDTKIADDVKISESDCKAGRFQNLFTRLRKQRKP